MRGKKILLIIVALLVAVAMLLVAPLALAAPSAATDTVALSPLTAIAVVGIVLGIVFIVLLNIGLHATKRFPWSVEGRQRRHPKGAPMIVTSVTTMFALVSGAFRMVMTALHHSCLLAIAAVTRRKTGIETRSHAPITTDGSQIKTSRQHAFNTG